MLQDTVSHSTTMWAVFYLGYRLKEDTGTWYSMPVLWIRWHFGTDPNPRISAFDHWIRSRLRVLLFSSFSFKTPTKNYFFLGFSDHYFLKVTLNHSSKIKNHIEVAKQYESWFSTLFLLDDRRSESGSVPLTNGSGSRRPQTYGC